MDVSNRHGTIAAKQRNGWAQYVLQDADSDDESTEGHGQGNPEVADRKPTAGQRCTDFR